MVSRSHNRLMSPYIPRVVDWRKDDWDCNACSYAHVAGVHFPRNRFCTPSRGDEEQTHVWPGILFLTMRYTFRGGLLNIRYLRRHMSSTTVLLYCTFFVACSAVPRLIHGGYSCLTPVRTWALVPTLLISTRKNRGFRGVLLLRCEESSALTRTYWSGSCFPDSYRNVPQCRTCLFVSVAAYTLKGS